MRFFLDDAEIEGTPKWTAVAIADFSNETGIAFPGRTRIANRVGCSVKTVQRATKQIESKGFFRIVGGLGKGNLQGYQFSKEAIQMSLNKQAKRGHSEPKRGHKRGQTDALLYKEEDKKEFKKEERDPRSDHPAIQMVKRITGRFPSKDLYDRIISEIGTEPNEELFQQSFTNWRSHDYRPTNLSAWLFEAARNRRAWSKNDGTNKQTTSERNFDRFTGTVDLANRIDQGAIDRIREGMSFVGSENTNARQLTDGDGTGSVDTGDRLGRDPLRKYTDQPTG